MGNMTPTTGRVSFFTWCRCWYPCPSSCSASNLPGQAIVFCTLTMVYVHGHQHEALTLYNRHHLVR
jgi:hypothetical protein